MPAETRWNLMDDDEKSRFAAYANEYKQTIVSAEDRARASRITDLEAQRLIEQRNITEEPSTSDYGSCVADAASKKTLR